MLEMANAGVAVEEVSQEFPAESRQTVDGS